MSGGIWSKADWLMDHQRKYVGTLELVSTGLSSRDAWSAGKTSQSVKYCSWPTTFQDLGLTCAVQDKMGIPSQQQWSESWWQTYISLRTKSETRKFLTRDKPFLGGQCRPEHSVLYPGHTFPLPDVQQNDAGWTAAPSKVWTGASLPTSQTQYEELEWKCNQHTASFTEKVLWKNVSWTKKCAQGLWTIFSYWSTDQLSSGYGQLLRASHTIWLYSRTKRSEQPWTKLLAHPPHPPVLMQAG